MRGWTAPLQTVEFLVDGPGLQDDEFVDEVQASLSDGRVAVLAVLPEREPVDVHRVGRRRAAPGRGR
jgi:hypothetical protein